MGRKIIKETSGCCFNNSPAGRLDVFVYPEPVNVNAVGPAARVSYVGDGFRIAEVPGTYQGRCLVKQALAENPSDIVTLRGFCHRCGCHVGFSGVITDRSRRTPDPPPRPSRRGIRLTP
jgi:hypothetical protein